MKHNVIKKIMVFLPAFALCAGLTACSGNPEKTAEKFLTSVQTQDFATAMSCMDEGNHLNRVFRAVEGASVPELDEVYRTFSKQMEEMTFEILSKGKNPGECTVRIKNRDYDTAIKEAMNAAIQSQIETGTNEFSNYAGWLGQGVAQAVLGEEAEETMTISKDNSGTIKTIDNLDFFDLLTGDFYSYTNLTMTTCTLTNEEQESTYYIAARGDRVMGCIMADTIMLDFSGATEEEVAMLVEETEKQMRGKKGIYGNATAGEGNITTTVGIDFNQTEQADLITMGLIDGSRGYQEYLSLKTTIEGFESQGMTCVTSPQYK
ncbi:DUF1307 domain-containing protein [Clostridiales bacterium TF09-2AC]|nr:DUF1307 domain-containing protein [Clostridiales bacterium TF09-2AC]